MKEVVGQASDGGRGAQRIQNSDCHLLEIELPAYSGRDGGVEAAFLSAGFDDCGEPQSNVRSMPGEASVRRGSLKAVSHGPLVGGYWFGISDCIEPGTVCGGTCSISCDLQVAERVPSGGGDGKASRN
jgi:hypothetical protein